MTLAIRSAPHQLAAGHAAQRTLCMRVSEEPIEMFVLGELLVPDLLDDITREGLLSAYAYEGL